MILETSKNVIYVTQNQFQQRNFLANFQQNCYQWIFKRLLDEYNCAFDAEIRNGIVGKCQKVLLL